MPGRPAVPVAGYGPWAIVYGYLAASVGRAGQATPMRALTVTNGGAGPDTMVLIHADPRHMVIIPQLGNDSDTYRSAAGTLPSPLVKANGPLDLPGRPRRGPQAEPAGARVGGAAGRRLLPRRQ